ncbi:alkylhydroperoxidase like protein, AhpD family [Clostridium aceticum]|uniref:Alkylhydroperoxidase like protein, AhpD family n=1 Tax=Clostridium aceticum TaxID=84022 RepID=A0A0D8I9C9_9CLOT|nr:carboxymuconolactone decarboxylase family protein [Clostridium aceticum]AKL93797.1 alkylhydroperoxidase like protein, AhpD family [Clostridium aceticum]KJF25826.1 4-carboxymuconolactone decarboxylase [Clostridium aceticum]
MTRNPREIFNEFVQGLGAVQATNASQVEAFMKLNAAAYKTDVVDLKTKELISVAIGAYNRCEYCIVFHVYKALEAGATREEIMEAAMVAVAFGAGPSMAYSVTLLKQSIDEFEKDFLAKA